MIDQKYIEMILSHIDIEDVVRKYQPNLKRVGHNLVGLCPLPGHQEKTPSFNVCPEKGIFKCFGCGKGGTVITFYMEMESVPFPIAVKHLLKEYLHINLEDAEIQRKPEDEQKELLRQSMLIYNQKIQEYFVARMQQETPDAKAARDYARKRWGEKFCKLIGIGYAPKSWTDFIQWTKSSSLEESILKQLGVVYDNEQYHNLTPFYYDRVTIPIRNRSGQIIGFSARTLQEDKSIPKYKNSKTSLIYNKDKSVFGIDLAAKQARIEEKLYLVEGGPDVLKLQSLEINNTVASLGGAWTENQFDELRKLHAKLCFIPDTDEVKPGEKLGRGFQNVMRNGTLAMRLGFSVSVREIPTKGTKKKDPDSYITSQAIFDRMEEEEFILWYARKTYSVDMLSEERLKFIGTLCDLILCINDEDLQEEYFSELVSKYGHRTAWQNGLKSAKRRKQEQQSKPGKSDGIDMLREFGFTQRGNAYYGTTKDGKEVRWSNFILKPLFHIKDDIRPVRLFEIHNDAGARPELVEMDMDTITSAKNLRKKMFGIGNYTWLADDNALIKLQQYLAQETETAVEIKQLGWNKLGFYCFCNGAWEDGQWHDVDKMGIVRLKAGNYYLPAMSQLYADSSELFANERKFIHKDYATIGMTDYFTKIIGVFGDNAKVGLCFYIATIFRDIIKPKTHFFPILNIFGPKGSGKTQLAETLSQFFFTDPEPPNLESASLASMSDYVASVCDAIVHLDEYKNGIPPIRIEWLKDLWGGIGRVKMNMDKDKKREQARVDAGIIVTGQEMPTSDIALFTRLVFLTYDKQHHNAEERRRYEDLQKYREMGATYITLQILGHRDSFETSWGNAWMKAGLDLERALRDEQVMDRIEHNWQVILAAYLAIEKTVTLPFSYEELFDICVEGAKRQNALCENTDEVAKFWNIIDSAHQKGTFKEGQDYMVKRKDTLYSSLFSKPIDYEKPKEILMIRKNIMLATYRQLGKQMDENLLPSESLLHYLETSPEYLGKTKGAQRFKRIGNDGRPIMEYETTPEGKVLSHTVYDKDRPLCFDYEQISQKYGIILDSTSEENDEESEDSKTDNGKAQGDLFDQHYNDDEPF